MYAMKPNTKMSQIPFKATSIVVQVEGVTHRLVPIDTLLDFTDTVAR